MTVAMDNFVLSAGSGGCCAGQGSAGFSKRARALALSLDDYWILVIGG